MAVEKYKWLDISYELFREYLYADGSVMRIEQPLQLQVSNSSMGGHAHRIVTGENYGVYVAPGWKIIRWKPKDGAVQFKF